VSKGKSIKKIIGKKTSFDRLRIEEFRIILENQHMKIVILGVFSKEETDRFIRRF